MVILLNMYDFKTYFHLNTPQPLMARYIFIFLACWMASGSTAAQFVVSRGDTIRYDVSTPRQAVITHLAYLQDDNYYPEVAIQAFEQEKEEPVRTMKGYKKLRLSKEEAIDLALKLKQVLDGKGIYVVTDDIPDQVNYNDSTSGKNRYYLSTEIPNIYLEKIGNEWLFPIAVADNIREAHKNVYPFGTDQLFKLLPNLGSESILGLHTWQWIAIAILILISLLVYRLLIFLLEYVIVGYLVKRGFRKTADHHLLPVVRPLSLLLVFSMLTLFIPIIQLPIEKARFLIKGIGVVVPILGILIFYRLVDILAMYFEKLAAKTEGTLDDQLVKLMSKVLKILVVLIGGLFVLQNLDFNITTLLAGISIGGLAIALAAQDTLKNFFGSLMIFVDKPFQIGDWIVSGSINGTVEEVGFRATRIRTFRDSLIYVPNAKLADSAVDNNGLRGYRRFYTTISITYDTPAHLIELFTEGMQKLVENSPNTRKDFYEIRLNDFGPHSLNIMFYIFFNVPTWSEELKCRHEMMLEVIGLAEELGVRFAFPTQTLHMENFPGQPSLSPQYTSDSEGVKKKMESFVANGKK